MFIVIDGACLWMSERREAREGESAHYVTAVCKCVFAFRFLSLTFLQFHWDSVINIRVRTDHRRKQRAQSTCSSSSCRIEPQ